MASEIQAIRWEGDAVVPYASMCLVAKPAAGLSDQPITVEEVTAVVARGAETVTAILVSAAAILAEAE